MNPPKRIRYQGQIFVLAETERDAEIIKMAKGWKKLPHGWTKDSLNSMWKSLGGSVKSCMEKIKNHPEITNHSAFCAALKRRVRDTTQ